MRAASVKTTRALCLAAACVSGMAADAAAQACDAKAAALRAYPSGEALPANLLRIYVYFTEPMARRDALPHLALLDATGRELPDVFLPTRYPLWSKDGRRLTLMLDPGRVKTGLKAHDALGRALVPGARYTLAIKADLPDAAGCGLKAAFQKSFRVVAEDLDPPAPDAWRIDPPRAGGREALRVALNGAHDHLSLAYRLRLRDAEGATLPGAIDIAEGESQWLFLPREPWAAGAYTLRVDPLFEDLAGNRPTGLFDDPTGAARQRQASAAIIERSIVIE